MSDTSVTATIHNPSKPYLHDHRDGSAPEFIAVHIGAGTSMFFDTKAELAAWHSALGAEIGALLPDRFRGDVADERPASRVPGTPWQEAMGQHAGDAADVIVATGI